MTEPNLFDIVRSTKRTDSHENDFVALANSFYENETHAGFVIKYKNNYFEFHFNDRIIYEILGEDFFHHVTSLIRPTEVPAFYSTRRFLKISSSVG